jgi:hypothetical protein
MLTDGLNGFLYNNADNAHDPMPQAVRTTNNVKRLKRHFLAATECGRLESPLDIRMDDTDMFNVPTVNQPKS